MVLTLGRRGALVLGGGGPLFHAPAQDVVATDTTGAGGTFAGILLASLHHRGLPLRQAVAAASAAAAITVQRRGTVSAFPDEAQIAAVLGA